MTTQTNASPFMVRLPADIKAFLAIRSKLSGRSMASEIKSMLEGFMANDPCTEIEIGKDRGRYVIRSRHSSEIFRSFTRKDLAVSTAQAALSEAGLDPASVIDMTDEEPIRAR